MTERTVKVKNSAGGRLTAANPLAEPGPNHQIYAIAGVPVEVSAADVVRHLSGICLAHRYDDPAAYTYEWAELAGKTPGSIIHRYRVASHPLPPAG